MLAIPRIDFTLPIQYSATTSQCCWARTYKKLQGRKWKVDHAPFPPLLTESKGEREEKERKERVERENKRKESSDSLLLLSTEDSIQHSIFFKVQILMAIMRHI